jgi:transposase-like protein
MSKKGDPVYSRELKLEAVRRMEAGVNVSALSRELQIKRKRLYAWRDSFRAGGPAGLRPRGRPPKVIAPPTEPEAVGSGERAPTAPPEPGVMAAPSGTVSAAEHAAAQRRIAELERVVGRQQMEMDFFRRALRRVGDARQPTGGSGVTASTRSSGT